MNRLKDGFTSKLLQSGGRRLTTLLTEISKQAANSTQAANIWLTTKREVALLSVLLVLSQLLPVYLPTVAVAQTAPYAITNVLVVNGILVGDQVVNGVVVKTGAQVWATTVSNIAQKFYSTHPTLTTSVTFTPFYNQSGGMFPDLIQSAQQATNVPNIQPYLDNVAAITDPNQGVFGLIGSGYYLSQFAESAIRARLTGPANARPQDYIDLVSAIKTALFTNKQRVVLWGHSQGNYYVNYAYQEVVADTASQASAGITLPNEALLSVINVADPASWSADGRYDYLTHCNDIINVVPQHLPSNIGSGANCAILDITAGPLTFSQVSGLVTTARTLETYPDWPSMWSYLLNHPLSFVWTSLTLLADITNMKYFGRLYFAVQQHSLDTAYLADGSDTQKKIYQFLEDSFPDPGCGGDTSCYLKDNFTSTTGDYTKNWLITQQLGLAFNPTESGSLTLQSVTAAGAVGDLTMRTRRVFIGPNSLSISLNHLGFGQSSVRLKNASNNSTVISLSLNSSPTSATFFPSSTSQVATVTGWHQLVFTKTDTQVFLSVDNKAGTVASSDPATGYYLELDSLSTQTMNIMEVQNLSIVRTIASPPPPPPATGTIKITVSGYSGNIGCTLNGNSITVPATLSNQTATGYNLVCSAPAGYSIGPISPSASQTLSSGGSISFAVTLIPTPTIGSIAITGTAVEDNNFDLTISNGNNIISGQTQAWVFDTNYCVNGCRHPDLLLTNISATGLTMHNANLAAGSHYVKLRNTNNGAWSNSSSTFSVAPLPFTVTPATTTLTIQQGSSGSLNFAIANVTAPTGSTVNNQIQTTGSAWPSGLVASVAPTVTLPAVGQSVNVQVSFTVPSSLAAGSYAIELQSSLGSIVELTDFILSVTAPTPTTGTDVISVTGFGGTIPCLLNNASVTAPVTVSNQTPGSQTLTCTPPSGYTLSISPSGSPSLSAGGTVNFTVTLTQTQSTPTLSISANGSNSSILQVGSSGGALSIIATYGNVPANSPITMSVSGLPANVTVPTVSATASGSATITLNSSYTVSSSAQPGTYSPTINVTVAGVTKTLTASLQITAATVTVYSNPLPVPSGSYTWSLSAWQSSGAAWVVPPVLNVAGVNYTYSHPEQYVLALQQIKSWGASGPLDQSISQFQAVLQSWPPYVIVSSGNSSQLTGYCAVNGSQSAQSFQTGSNIVWNAYLSGGTGSDNFAWSGVSAGNTQSVVMVPTSPATYNLSVRVSDSGNPVQQISLTCPTVTVTATPSLGCGCSLSPNPVKAGSGATLSAFCVGGTGSYTIQLPGSSSFSSSSSQLVMLSSPGTQTYTITGKDSSGATASGSCTLTAN